MEGKGKRIHHKNPLPWWAVLTWSVVPSFSPESLLFCRKLSGTSNILNCKAELIMGSLQLLTTIKNVVREHSYRTPFVWTQAGLLLPKLLLDPWPFLSYHSSEDADRKTWQSISVVYNKIMQKPPAKTLMTEKPLTQKMPSQMQRLYLLPQT